MSGSHIPAVCHSHFRCLSGPHKQPWLRRGELRCWADKRWRADRISALTYPLVRSLSLVRSHSFISSQARIGQAHLLDTIIDNLELELADSQQEQSERGVRVLPQKSYYARRTLTYGLGEQVS